MSVELAELAHDAPRDIPLPKVIVAGGCGFLGHHIVEHFFINRAKQNQIVVLDKLSYASEGFERLRDTRTIEHVRCYCVDLTEPLSTGVRYEIGDDVEFIVHTAAETYSPTSITNPVGVITNNVMGLMHMLEYARGLPSLKAFFFLSPAEVYGPAHENEYFKEIDRHRPKNPYSASKSACEQLCTSYCNTFKLPIIILHITNAFGERQHPEQFIPNLMKRILTGEMVSIYSYPPSNLPGSRFYIHARNIADAILFILKNGKPGEMYNLTGEKEINHLELAQKIAKIIGKPLKYRLVSEGAAYHGQRFALDGSKLAQLGWKPPKTFEESLERTIRWTLENPIWLYAIGDSTTQLITGAPAPTSQPAFSSGARLSRTAKL